MFIITNSCLEGEYTPSIANTIDEARDWLKSCTADNIRTSAPEEYNLDKLSDEEVINWANENYKETFTFNENHSFIRYADGTYNFMSIYDIDKIPDKPHPGCRCWLTPVK